MASMQHESTDAFRLRKARAEHSVYRANLSEAQKSLSESLDVREQLAEKNRSLMLAYNALIEDVRHIAATAGVDDATINAANAANAPAQDALYAALVARGKDVPPAPSKAAMPDGDNARTTLKALMEAVRRGAGAADATTRAHADALRVKLAAAETSAAEARGALEDFEERALAASADFEKERQAHNVTMRTVARLKAEVDEKEAAVASANTKAEAAIKEATEAAAAAAANQANGGGVPPKKAAAAALSSDAPDGNGSAAAAKEKMEAEAHIEDLKALVAQHESNVHNLETDNARLQSELENAKNGTADVRGEVSRLQRKISEQAGEIAAAQKARADALAKVQAAEAREATLAARNDSLAAAAKASDARVSDYEKIKSRKSELERAVASLEGEMEAMRRKVGRHTAAELKTLVETHEKERSGLRARCDRAEASRAEAEAALATRAAEAKRHAGMAAELDALRAAMLRGAGDAGREAERAAAAAAADSAAMRAMLAAIVAEEGAAAGEAAEMAALRAEVATLREHRVAAANEGEPRQQPSSSDEAVQLRESVAELTRRCGELASEAADAKSEAAEAKANLTGLESELMSIATAYEEAQAQATGLLGRLSDRDDEHRKIVEESTACKRMAENAQYAKQEHDRTVRNWVNERTQLQTRAEELEKKFGESEKAAKARAEEYAKLQAKLDETRALLDEALKAKSAAELSLKDGDSKVAQTRKDVDQLRMEVAEERSKRKRAEEHRDLAAKKAARVAPPGGGGGSGGGGMNSQERAHYKELGQMMSDSVDRREMKEQVIMRCGHMFSQKTIDERLKSRNRKCPNCNCVFAASDVLTIHWV